MRRNQRSFNPYNISTGHKYKHGDPTDHQLVTVNEDGIPLYQHSFGTVATQAQQSMNHYTNNIPQSRERRHNRVLSGLGHHLSSETSAKPILLTTHHTDAKYLPDSDQDTPRSPQRHLEHPEKLHDKMNIQHAIDSYSHNMQHEMGVTCIDQRESFEDKLRSSSNSLTYDNRVLNKLLDKLTENKKEIMSAYTQISSLEEMCALKDDHIKSLRNHIMQIEEAKEYAEKTIHEYSLKSGNKYEKSTGEARPSTKEVKLQTRLQSHVLSTILDRANVNIKYDITNFVQEENEDSDETRILVGTDHKDLLEEESPLDHIVDIVVSRYKTIEQEILKEEDFIPLCQICSHAILKNQLSKKAKEAEALLQNTSENQDLKDNSTTDDLYHKERTIDEQIDDNIRLGHLLDEDFHTDIETVKTETIDNLSAEYTLQMAVFLPNTHNLLINGLEMVCQHRTGLYAINFTNPYIRSTLQGNFNNVHDAQVPKAFGSRAEELRTQLIMTMQNELILRQRHRFNSLVSQKIPKVLFSHNTKDTNVLHVEATREHYLKYFRNYREYREVTPADVLYEATRGQLSRYYENCTDIPQPDKDAHILPTCKRSGSVINSSSGNYSTVYMGQAQGTSPGLSDNETPRTQLQLDLPNSIYDISNTLSSDSTRESNIKSNVRSSPPSIVMLEDQPTNTYSITLPSATHIGASVSSPSDTQRIPEKVQANGGVSTSLNNTLEVSTVENIRHPPRIIPSTAPKAALENLSALETLASANAIDGSFLERSNVRERPSAKALLPNIGHGGSIDESSAQFLTMPMQLLPDISEFHSSVERDKNTEIEGKEIATQKSIAPEINIALPISEASPLQQYRNKIHESMQLIPSLSDISAISDMAKHVDE